MDILIKRELKTNIGFIESLNDISLGEYIVSIHSDHPDFAELHIRGEVESSKNKIEILTETTDAIISMLNRLSLHRQSHLELANAVAVYYGGSGADRIFDAFISKKLNSGGLAVNSANKLEIQKMLNNPISEAMNTTLLWLRRCINSTFAYESFFFAVLACESLTMDIEQQPKCIKGCELSECTNHHRVGKRKATNHPDLIKILGGDLHKKIYRGSDPIRNRLFHGSYVSEGTCANLLNEIYPKLVKHLGTQFGLSLRDLEIPARGFRDAQGWIKLTYKPQLPDLSIPNDTPSIKELLDWWGDGPQKIVQEPKPPKYIQALNIQ